CATVFSKIGRSDRPSVKKSEGESGRFFGWLAISCLRYWQPDAKSIDAAAHAMTRKREVLVIGYLGNMMRFEALENPGGLGKVKLRVAQLAVDKGTIRRGVREA